MQYSAKILSAFQVSRQMRCQCLCWLCLLFFYVCCYDAHIANKLWEVKHSSNCTCKSSHTIQTSEIFPRSASDMGGHVVSVNKSKRILHRWKLGLIRSNSHRMSNMLYIRTFINHFIPASTYKWNSYRISEFIWCVHDTAGQVWFVYLQFKLIVLC